MMYYTWKSLSHLILESDFDSLLKYSQYIISICIDTEL
jgi:hypothetical protein